MKRLGRYVARSVVSLSLLLCAATCAAWVRSHWHSDVLAVQTVERFGTPPFGPVDDQVEYAAGIDAGAIIVSQRRGTFGMPWVALRLLPTRLGERHWTFRSGDRIGGHSWLPSAEHVRWFHAGGVDAEDAWKVPFWIVVLATALLPAGSLVWRRRRRGRAHAGICAACGYDLRATPDRCPECGAMPT